ncbi:GGDEF domain-containing protein [Modestobacter sp. VKM Ac-2981]|nr:GGDEF domain-containing protein [Modestobacter sp. VKM Ac-2981]MCZ2826707.1 GGDEF domain-containing protein [Modestobacter sp. VKM Ac-2981]
MCGSATDQRRYRDMHARMRKGHLFGVALGSMTLLSSIWYGPWLLVMFVITGATMALGLAVTDRARHPEVAGAATFMLLQIAMAVQVALTGGLGSPLLTLLVVPLFTQAVLFRPQVLLTAVSGCGLLAVAATLGATLLPRTEPAPPWLVLPGFFAVLGCLALAGHFLATSDLTARDGAVVDPLTGLFNRASLTDRFADARAQARALDRELGLVVLDLDHFKVVNDSHGHARGDEVLQAFADRLRTAVRSTDLVYRMGGEEFLVLLPGHDQPEAVAVAERIRASVAAAPLAGLSVTVSAGVTSARDEALSLRAMTDAADRALYAAKRGGRNCTRAMAVRLPDAAAGAPA